MTIVSSTMNDIPTFRMIPISKECPYNEIIYNPVDKLLAIISKEKKESLKLIPKLNDAGDCIMTTPFFARNVGAPGYLEERTKLETYYEYYISDKKEIIDFVTLFANNSDTFNFSKLL